MSKLLINIRFLFWHLKVTTDWEWSFSLNKYHLNLRTLIAPIGFYEFRFYQIFGIK